MNDRVENKLYEAINFSIPTYTEFFVTPNIYKKYSDKYLDINIILKGYDRKQIYFIPKIFIPYNNFDIVYLKIEVKNKFKEYSHKDFLGSILALNIKREQIGDLFVENNICYLVTNEKISKYIIENLKEIGKNSCIITEVFEIPIGYNFKEYEINVSSLRLDNIVKGITKLSREKAIEIIEEKLVQIDYEPVIKKDKIIKLEDIISIRKYGKYILKNISLTKKGKYKLKLNKYN